MATQITITVDGPCGKQMAAVAAAAVAAVNLVDALKARGLDMDHPISDATTNPSAGTWRRVIVALTYPWFTTTYPNAADWDKPFVGVARSMLETEPPCVVTGETVAVATVP